MNDTDLKVIGDADIETVATESFGETEVSEYSTHDAEIIDDDGELYSDEEWLPDDGGELYSGEEGFPDDVGCDWKSVDINPACDFTDDAIQNNTGSGGGGTPPPPPPSDTASSGADQEPEPSRKFPSWLATLKSEKSEYSEGHTFSSSDFGDSDWISPIYPKSLWLLLADMDEPPYYEGVMRDGSVKITGLNECFFAVYTILKANLHMHHGNWFAYSEERGIWHQLNKTELLLTIRRCVLLLGKTLQIDEFRKFCSTRFRKEVIENMLPFPDYVDIFDHTPKNVINVKNGTIVIGNDGSIVLHEHSPEFLCRSMIDANYDPSAKSTDFTRELFRDVVSPEDQEVIQHYVGQCALGWNLSQTILIINGDAGTGKSVIVNVVEKMLGRGAYEGLRTSMLDQRFELSRFEGKSLLVASDQCSDALMKKGAHMLKALTGGDDLTTERKCENEHSMIRGCFNVIIVSNADLPLSIDGDGHAWGRRVLPVEYRGEPPKKIIRDFPDHIMRKYLKEVLKWAVDGAAAVYANGKRINPHPEMLRRIDELIQMSDAPYAFVKNCVVHTGNPKDTLSSFALYTHFTASKYFVGSGSKLVIQRKLGMAMKEIFKAVKRNDIQGDDGKAKSGYVGYRVERNDME